jgi:hypothetical protein
LTRASARIIRRFVKYGKILGVGIFCLLGIIAPLRASADTIALSFTGGTPTVITGATLGWTFTLSAPVVVTSLGYFDDSNDGLMATHPIAIWDSGGTLQVSGTVPSAGGGTLQNGFRYVAVTPMLLLAGNYTIGGLSPSGFGGDILMFNASSVSTAPQIAYGASRSVAGGSLTFPSGNDVGAQPNAWFGPNFQFLAVPEPATWTLCVCGGVAALAFYRSRRRN